MTSALWSKKFILTLIVVFYTMSTMSTQSTNVHQNCFAFDLLLIKPVEFGAGKIEV